MAVLLKVYGHIYPCSQTLETELEEALETAIRDPISEDIPLLEREKDLLRISFEGSYFPIDEVLAVFRSNLAKDQKGKLDVLDLEAWHMTRYLFDSGTITERSNSLNSVLDFSGF